VDGVSGGCCLEKCSCSLASLWTSEASQLIGCRGLCLHGKKVDGLAGIPQSWILFAMS
jgi:hypothetical protein